MQTAFKLFVGICLLISFRAQAEKLSPPPQFVMLAFDGSKSLSFWKESRDFAKSSNVRFTYFISGVYFVSPSNRTLYRPPAGIAPGRSDIGVGANALDIEQRMKQVLDAAGEGNEIASHANGHFDGSRWSRESWLQEFGQFESLLFHSAGNNKIPWSTTDVEAWQKTIARAGLGFRAPLLATSQGLWQAMETDRVVYDTSGVTNSTAWPTKSRFGFWNFPLVSLRISGSCRATLSMDYNFYVAQTGARDDIRNTAVYEEQMFRTYMDYFNRNYAGNRAPLNIGHHFSKWNGGAYWRAMKRFALAVCSKPDVRCATYSELAEFMESNQASLGRWIASARPVRDLVPATCGSELEMVPGAMQFDPPEAHIEE